MADALRIRTRISCKTLTISDLERFMGKRVEVIVLEDDDAENAPLPAPARNFGSLAGKLEVANDFDDALPADLQRDFEGEGEA
jgi:hypothetical protein